MQKTNESILRRLAKALHDQYDDIADQPLPRKRCAAPTFHDVS